MEHSRPELVADAIHIDANGVHIGQYHDYQLFSAYQPIWHYSAQRGFSPYGYEGLIRPTKNGEMRTPSELFKNVESADALFVECMCHALHLRNYHHCRPGQGSLFFNVNPESYPSINEFDKNFRIILEKLEQLGQTRDRIVLEVVETEQGADGVLTQIRNFARSEGIKLAIDDFGQNCSTVERYLDFMPDIVKVDREVFTTACDSLIACKLLHTVIEQFHDHGTVVLIEGIETHRQFEVATTLGADLFQGFLLGKPTVLPNNFLAPNDVAQVGALYA